MSLRTNWRLYIALLVIIAMSWMELQHISEATSVEEIKRKIFHLVFLGGIYATGLWFWHQHQIKWMKNAWTLAYTSLTVLLLTVGLVQWKFDLLAPQVLDQVRHIRVFFSSPLPFIILLLIPRMETSLANSSASLEAKNRN